MTRLLLLVMVMLASGYAAADTAQPTENDPLAQSRAVKLSEQLRCLVCQNQSIAESNAELALDLRRQIHEQIAAGKSDADIVDYMVARYGDFVLYRPPVRATTALLWGGPALLLVLGFFVLYRVLRTRRTAAPLPALTTDEHAQAARMLGDATEHGR